MRKKKAEKVNLDADWATLRGMPERAYMVLPLKESLVYAIVRVIPLSKVVERGCGTYYRVKLDKFLYKSHGFSKLDQGILLSSLYMHRESDDPDDVFHVSSERLLWTEKAVTKVVTAVTSSFHDIARVQIDAYNQLLGDLKAKLYDVAEKKGLMLSNHGVYAVLWALPKKRGGEEGPMPRFAKRRKELTLFSAQRTPRKRTSRPRTRSAPPTLVLPQE